VTPLACGSSAGDHGPQTLAANLAERGLVAAVTEGFCGNGARAALLDASPSVGYARQLLGLRSDTAVHLQEVVSALTWVTEHYPSVARDRAGAAGYSYGGGLSLLLAQVDPRVSSVSLPATYLGQPCETGALPPSDLYLQSDGRSDFLWNAPLDVPPTPQNAHVLMLYPRFVHATAGAADRGGPASAVAGVMRYARELWTIGGYGRRLLFRADDGDHHYGRSRREDTYAWFRHTLLEEPTAPSSELELRQWKAARLAVDITGTRTLAGELHAASASERTRRFRDGRPTPEAAEKAQRAANDIFGGPTTGLNPELVWRGAVEGRAARAVRFRGGEYDVPTLQLEGAGPRGSGTLLFIPERGVSAELRAVAARTERFERVVASDCLGVGGLASERLLLHTVARALMFSASSLPVRNVSALRRLLHSLDVPVEIEASGWATSTYAAVLRATEPQRVRGLHLAGVPEDELLWVGSGKRVPDLLLHPSLFSRLTVAELAR
jgi:hypothetical protein